MYSPIVILSFVACFLAMAITEPTDNSVYPTTGAITLSWTSVSSDQPSFQPVLISPNQETKINLGQPVMTSVGSVSLSAPGTGWPVGNSWKINAYSVPSATNNSPGILAQSGSFNVTTSGAVISTGGTLPTTMINTMPTTAVVAATGATGTTGTGTVAPSATNLNPTATGGALAAIQASSTLMALVAVIHAFVL